MINIQSQVLIGLPWTRSCLLVSEETPVLVGSCALVLCSQHEAVSPHPLVPRFPPRSFCFGEGPGSDPNRDEASS